MNSDEWFAEANFREYDLKAIAVGDCATVYSMIDRRRPIRAVVQGIGSGVLDTDKVNVPKSVPYVERELNWVRVACAAAFPRPAEALIARRRKETWMRLQGPARWWRSKHEAAA